MRISLCALAGLTSCATSSVPVERAPPRADPVVVHPTAARQRELESLNRRASGREPELSSYVTQCGAVFELFTRFIKPGMSGADVAHVLTDYRWITFEGVYENNRPEVPVTGSTNHPTLLIHCAGGDDETFGVQAEYMLYLRISDPGIRRLTQFMGMGDDVFLDEYVLEHPDQSFDVFSKSRGVFHVTAS